MSSFSFRPRWQPIFIFVLMLLLAFSVLLQAEKWDSLGYHMGLRKSPPKLMIMFGSTSREGLGAIIWRYKFAIAFARFFDLQVQLDSVHSVWGYQVAHLFTRTRAYARGHILQPVTPQLKNEIRESCKLGRPTLGLVKLAQEAINSAETILWHEPDAWELALNDCVAEKVRDILGIKKPKVCNEKYLFHLRAGDVKSGTKMGAYKRLDEAPVCELAKKKNVTIDVVSTTKPVLCPSRMNYIDVQDPIETLRLASKYCFLLIGGSSYASLMAMVANPKKLYLANTSIADYTDWKRSDIEYI